MISKIKLNIMKKQLFLILLTISFIAKAQNKTDSKETENQKHMTEHSKIKRHSLSLDVITELFFPAINPRYEYKLNKHSSIGADLNININADKGSKNSEDFSFSPYYRQYFFSKEDYDAKGFYGEGFLKFYSDKDYFETAVGLGMGWKWVSNSSFFIDVNGGLGPNIYQGFTGKFGVNLGWQF
jgi:hypothetical protein